jgi:hypothetical protein
MTVSERRDDRCKSSAQFGFWNTVFALQVLLWTFIRSLRLGKFLLYVECLQKVAPWFFACDQTNYAHWIPFHIRDMLLLKDGYPNIYK